MTDRSDLPRFDLYRELGVPRDASTGAITAAYRTLAKQHHPDRAGAAGAARMERLNTAREWLTDPERRARYDRARATGPATSGKRQRGPAPSAPAARARAGTTPASRSTSRGPSPTRIVVGAVAALIGVSVVLGGGAIFLGGGAPPTPRPTASSAGVPGLAPPAATPLADPPAEPAGSGLRAIMSTELGTIEIELFDRSAPVAAENFANLAEAGYFDGQVFHRVIPGFVIQGGDPEGTGRGGPGYRIRDDPVVGDYVRGMLAMARPANPDGSVLPDSAGSQFFIILDDLRQRLPESGRYAIFGRVVAGMEVVDAIATRETTGPPQDRPLDPVTVQEVTLQRP